MTCADGSAAVGFAQFDRWTSFSAVKNAIGDGVAKQKAGNAAEVAATGEADLYYWAYRLLKEAGCDVADPVQTVIRDIQFALPPRIVLTPQFGCTQKEVRQRFPTGANVKVSARSTLILDGDITVRSLNLDGTLIVRVAPGGKVVIDGLTVANKGWTFQNIEDDSKVPQAYAIRGYTLNKIEQKEYIFDGSANVTLGQ